MHQQLKMQTKKIWFYTRYSLVESLCLITLPCDCCFIFLLLQAPISQTGHSCWTVCHVNHSLTVADSHFKQWVFCYQKSTLSSKQLSLKLPSRKGGREKVYFLLFSSSPRACLLCTKPLEEKASLKQHQ